MRTALAASFAILLCSPALADLDGHLLHRMCKAKNMEFVSGFVVGVTDKAAADAALVTALIVDKAGAGNRTGPQLWTESLKAMRTVQPFCIPKGTKLGEMTEFVCNALEMLPDARRHKAAALTADVLKVKYPCGNEGPPHGFKPEDFVNRPKAD
jgi:hypothetical protein